VAARVAVGVAAGAVVAWPTGATLAAGTVAVGTGLLVVGAGAAPPHAASSATSSATSSQPTCPDTRRRVIVLSPSLSRSRAARTPDSPSGTPERARHRTGAAITLLLPNTTIPPSLGGRRESRAARGSGLARLPAPVLSTAFSERWRQVPWLRRDRASLRVAASQLRDSAGIAPDFPCSTRRTRGPLPGHARLHRDYSVAMRLADAAAGVKPSRPAARPPPRTTSVARVLAPLAAELATVHQ
jgi:hypothetical protein